MQTMTSAYANKMLKSLEEDKAFWVNKEATSSTYVAAINEERLKDKMLLLGHKDYPAACGEIAKMIEEDTKARMRK